MTDDHSGEATQGIAVRDAGGRGSKRRLDRLYDVLADERRRRLLSYLHRKDSDVASLVELIDYLVVHEADSVADLDTDDVAISLYHTDLPKLADAGLVEYDERSRTVRYRGGGVIEEAVDAPGDARWE